MSKRVSKRPPFFKGRVVHDTPRSPRLGVPEARSVSSSDPYLAGQVADLRRDLQKERRIRAMERMTDPLKKLCPTGIQYPDDMVKNRHLYTGGPGRTRFLK